METTGTLRIEPISEQNQDQVKQFVLDGLAEHFGFLDTSLNPDLHNIIDHYTNQGHVFLVGCVENEAVCCGALIPYDDHTGRIVRMSVKKTYRRHGYASRIIKALEEEATRQGYSGIMLKTLAHWADAVGFYQSKGYEQNRFEGDSVVMTKAL
ncbi:GNAT family N-acetyltransferase [Paenibacillus sp. RC67]|uniref:GNAT family N-acetyltransferase n=1 Tax=Paenibacillus sp. RC67 TaxID=3039392 RepID=UPI0024AD399F|nr:GNAT family N-acetyltransferase [Paenibacillus sp. RC67]